MSFFIFRAEDRNFYILVGIAAALVVIIILGIALVLLYFGKCIIPGLMYLNNTLMYLSFTYNQR